MGGIVDPKTGEVIWTLHVPLAEQRAYYAAHPPRHLAPLRCTPTEAPGIKLDGHGEPVNAIFRIACPCGEQRFALLAHVEDDEWTSPIEVECSACQEIYVVHDPREHGHDGALGNNQLELSDHCDELATAAEPPYEVIVRFEIPSDELGSPDRTGPHAPEDLYSWITVIVRGGDGSLEVAFEEECA